MDPPRVGHTPESAAPACRRIVLAAPDAEESRAGAASLFRTAEWLVAALRARPDWLLTTNTRHFTPKVARSTGLKICTAQQVLERVQILRGRMRCSAELAPSVLIASSASMRIPAIVTGGIRGAMLLTTCYQIFVMVKAVGVVAMPIFREIVPGVVAICP